MKTAEKQQLTDFHEKAQDSPSTIQRAFFMSEIDVRSLEANFEKWWKDKRVYAWSHRDGKNDSDERFVAVLEIPPVDSAQSAVKVAIAAEVKGKK